MFLLFFLELFSNQCGMENSRSEPWIQMERRGQERCDRKARCESAVDMRNTVNDHCRPADFHD